MLARGDTFGAYRIVARLKAGGMAQLYLARREGAAGFTRPVALKVIHAHLAREQEFVGKFVDEATLSSKIHDPNVVHVEDLGQANGGLFLAMEYVHGAALGAVFKAAQTAKRRLSPALVAHITAQIASGLHAAHETADEQGVPLGIVHRDVSPQNVLVAFKGHVKVIDFGIAKALGRAHQTNHSGLITGKIAYMPPEQAKGEPVDRRTDVYALGIITWELLAGRRLFEADNDIALLCRVRDPRVQPPSAHAPEIPPALDAVVMAMLAPDAKRRPATALDVKRMLLDAVPEARAVEAHDVAALLRALLPDQIAAQDKQLASFDAPARTEPAEARPSSSGSSVAAAAPSAGSLPPFVSSAASPAASSAAALDHAPDEATAERDGTAEIATTERFVEPAEALQMLTVPAVVLPYAAVPEASAGDARSPASRGPSPRMAMLLAIAAVLALVLMVIAAVVKRSRSGDAGEGTSSGASAAADESPPAAADGVGASPTPSAAEQGPTPPATAAAVAVGAPIAIAAPIAAAPSATTPRASAERPRATPPRRSPKGTATAAPQVKPRCRIVGGVELCE